MGKDKSKKKDDKEKAKFSDAEMAKKLDDFHSKAYKKTRDPKIQKRVGNGDQIIQKPMFKNNPTAIKEGLLKNFPDMKKDMKFLDEWAKYLEKNPPEEEEEKPSTPAAASTPKPPPPPALKPPSAFEEACDGYFSSDPAKANLLRKLLADYIECIEPSDASKLEAMPANLRQVIEKGMILAFHERLVQRYGDKKDFQYLVDYNKEIEARQQQEEIIEQQQEQIDQQAKILERQKSEIASNAASSHQSPAMQAAGVAGPPVSTLQEVPAPQPPAVPLSAPKPLAVDSPSSHPSHVINNQPVNQLQVPPGQYPVVSSAASIAQSHTPQMISPHLQPQLQSNGSVAGLHIPNVDQTQLNALIEAGWQPPAHMSQQNTPGLGGLDGPVGQSLHDVHGAPPAGVSGNISPFLPGPTNTRDRGVSGSPDSSLPRSRRRFESDGRDDRSTAAWSEGGSRSGRTTPFRSQLVQQIKELQEIHKELASHQRSQMDLLNKQQYINEHVYHPDDKPMMSSGIPQTGMRRYSANSNATGGRMFQPSGVPSALDVLRQSSGQVNHPSGDDKRIDHIEEELGRLRNVCSQLMGLVQQAYSLGTKNSVTPQQQPTPEKQPPQQDPDPQHQHQHQHQDQPLWVQHYSSDEPVYNEKRRPEKTKKSIFSFFNRSRKSKQPAKEHVDRHRRRSKRDEEIELFRERVVHADNLIRQFRKITSSSSGHVRHEAAFVQQQLAALSQALRAEAKSLGLLPPSPPHTKTHSRYYRDDTTDYSSVESASTYESSLYSQSRTTATPSDVSDSPPSYSSPYAVRPRRRRY